MLMGIVTKNSILLVEYAVMARQRARPVAHRRADRCVLQARAPDRHDHHRDDRGHVSGGGGLSADPSFRAPMGIAVIGGLITSTALSLFVVPTVYTVLDDWQEWLARKTRRSATPVETANAGSVVAELREPA